MPPLMTNDSIITKLNTHSGRRPHLVLNQAINIEIRQRQLRLEPLRRLLLHTVCRPHRRQQPLHEMCT